jgi:SET domain/MYND finger
MTNKKVVENNVSASPTCSASESESPLLVEEFTNKMICDACSKPGENLLSCARCKQAWYHNKKCQVDHFPHHKAKCRQLVAAAKAVGPAGSSAVSVARQQEVIATVDTQGQHTIADGIKVIETDDLGRACIAAKAFSIGDTVLLEPPAIVFDERSGYVGLFEAFLKARPETQQRILKMYRPPEDKLKEFMDEKRSKIRTQRKHLLVQQYSQFIQANPQHKQALSLALADQLIGVVDANAHAFQTNHTVDMVATPTGNNAIPHTYHALFSLGSRIEHSCSPNLTFITQGGKLEYLAEMKIQPNERLSISYLGGVYERPRKKRQGFLKENKAFLCACTRCMGWDECSPLRCCCANGSGVLFHNGKRDQWECQMCNKKVRTKDCPKDDHMCLQLRGEADFQAKIRKFQHILQSQPYPEMLDEILDIVRKPKWTKILHPLHWLNVEVFKLLSSVATSAARYYAKEANNNNNNGNNNHQKNHYKQQLEKAPFLLRLSALSMLRRVIWTERIAAINRGVLSLAEAAKAASKEDFAMFSPNAVRVEDVEAVVKDLCDYSTNQLQLKELGTLGVSSAFHAGQDLIFAGHYDLAWKVYKRFEKSFQNWNGLSDTSRSKIKAFLDSNGQDNQFGNFLLL